MLCPIQSGENAEWLLAYCARKLDPATMAALEQHMQHCEECRTFGAQQKLVWEALDCWEAMPVSPDFDQRLYRRIEQSQERRRWAAVLAPGWLSGLLRPSRSLAAASVLVLAVLLLRSPAPVAVPASDSAEWLEVERAESALEDIEVLRALNLMARADGPAERKM